MTEWKGCFPRVKQFFQRNIFYFSITLMLILRGGVMQVVLTNFSDVLGGRFYGLSLRLLYISPVSLFWSHASPWTSTIHGVLRPGISFGISRNYTPASCWMEIDWIAIYLVALSWERIMQSIFCVTLFKPIISFFFSASSYLDIL